MKTSAPLLIVISVLVAATGGMAQAGPFVLPGATHMLHVQNPQGMAEGLAAFFGRHLPHAAYAQGHAMPPAHAEQLVAAAIAQTRSSVTYDGSYRRIPYPGGDVPETIGVCTDVVIRAYRRVGVDLQVKVHEDMKRAFRSYPQQWGMSGPDPNIDHRRVPNLQTFLRRAGAELPASRDQGAYRAGDLVSWMLPRNLPHIGIVTGERSPTGTPLVVHNIGRGPEVEDILFRHRITGHYRYSTH